MQNITIEELEIFLKKADFVFVYHESTVEHTYSIDNLITEVNSKFIDLYIKDKESYTMRIIKENVVDVLIDDNEELGWTIELHMNDESVITLEWLL